MFLSNHLLFHYFYTTPAVLTRSFQILCIFSHKSMSKIWSDDLLRCQQPFPHKKENNGKLDECRILATWVLKTKMWLRNHLPNRTKINSFPAFSPFGGNPDPLNNMGLVWGIIRTVTTFSRFVCEKPVAHPRSLLTESQDFEFITQKNQKFYQTTHYTK